MLLLGDHEDLVTTPTRGGESDCGLPTDGAAVEAPIAAIARVALYYLGSLVAIATLTPADGGFPAMDSFTTFSVDGRDVLRNLWLLIPIGVVYRMCTPKGGRLGLDALAWGSLVAAVIETAQLLVPGRDSSVLDLCCNAAGAWLGARACQLLWPWLQPRMVAHLGHSTPLTHGLLPLSLLITLSSIIGNNDPRQWAFLPLGGAGALIWVATWRHSRGALSHCSLGQVSLLAGAWMELVMWPAPSIYCWWGLRAAAWVVAVTYVVGRLGGPATDGRRYEVPTARWVLPLVVIFGFMTTLWSATTGGSNLAGVTASPLLLIEHMAMLSVVGYVAAQAVGRLFEQDLVPVVVAVAAAMAVSFGIEVLRVGLSGQHIGPLAVMAGVLGGLWGGLLYCAQRTAARTVRQSAAVPGGRVRPPVRVVQAAAPLHLGPPGV